MALNKNKRTWPCLVHTVLYTLPFLVVTRSFWALWVIWGTHFLIDRFSLPKYLVWVKNHLSPWCRYPVWQDCKVTGYYDVDSYLLVPFPHRVVYREYVPQIRPRFITIWLTIITDNGLHLACNYLALTYL